jgi:hypothetical protein
MINRSNNVFYQEALLKFVQFIKNYIWINNCACAGDVIFISSRALKMFITLRR